MDSHLEVLLESSWSGEGEGEGGHQDRAGCKAPRRKEGAWAAPARAWPPGRAGFCQNQGTAASPPQEPAPSVFWCVLPWEQSAAWESLPFVAVLLYEPNENGSFLNVLMNKTRQKMTSAELGRPHCFSCVLRDHESWKIIGQEV